MLQKRGDEIRRANEAVRRGKKILRLAGDRKVIERVVAELDVATPRAVFEAIDRRIEELSDALTDPISVEPAELSEE